MLITAQLGASRDRFEAPIKKAPHRTHGFECAAAIQQACTLHPASERHQAGGVFMVGRRCRSSMRTVEGRVWPKHVVTRCVDMVDLASRWIRQATQRSAAVARYLITYHAGEMPDGPESMAKARDAFMSWAEKTGATLVDPGAPVRESRTILVDGRPQRHAGEFGQRLVGDRGYGRRPRGTAADRPPVHQPPQDPAATL